MLERRTRLAPMSARRLAELAEAGNPRPFSTLTNRGRLNRVSALDRKPSKPARPAYTGPTRSVCAVVDARSGRICEWPGCMRPQVERHHRLNRKQGGRKGAARERVNGVAWLLGVCRPHHDMVTSPTGDVRALVESMGWVLREHQDAEATPVVTRHATVPVVLGPDGGWRVAS